MDPKAIAKQIVADEKADCTLKLMAECYLWEHERVMKYCGQRDSLHSRLAKAIAALEDAEHVMDLFGFSKFGPLAGHDALLAAQENFKTYCLRARTALAEITEPGDGKCQPIK